MRDIWAKKAKPVARAKYLRMVLLCPLVVFSKEPVGC